MSRNGSANEGSSPLGQSNSHTPLTRFWLALETLPGLAAVTTAWCRLLGSEYDFARQFFTPYDHLASSYPRLDGSSCSAPYTVIEHGPDDFVGVSPEDGATVPLTESDLIVHQVDRWRLQRGITGAFGFDPDGTSVGSTSFTYQAGFYRPLAGYSFAAYLTIQTEPTDYRQAIESIAARDCQPFLLLAPTNRFHRRASEEIVKSRGACFIPLADALALGHDGRLVLTATGNQRLAGFRRAVLPTEVADDAVVFFPTPADAKWSDLRIRFIDGHTIAVKIGGVTRNLHYAQMGMVDRRNAKPTKQWEQLYTFARGYGVLTWASRDAGPKNQKRREVLAGDLKRFFRIDGDPIVLTDNGKGWRTVFGLEPDN